MRSLRARLLAGVLIIAAVGLVALAAVTYAEQRSFLLERLDAQAVRAPGAMGHVLSENGIGEPDRGPGPGGGPEAASLPPGTYGERRDASGAVLGALVVGYQDGRGAPRPALPADLGPGTLRTVDGTDGTRFRVAAQVSPLSGELTVAAVPLTEVDQTLERLLLVEGLVIVGVLLALGLAAWGLVRVGLRPLDRIEATAGRIAGGDLSHRVETTDPRTEAGRLGVALNAMLDRLEKAFAERRASEERLRRFLADASHELRTPLASIRGYAELYRMGATREPAELERSMRRVEDEAARMGVLVEDLLTLARLDEVADAPHAPVDVAALARDAADDARATAPGRPIALDAPAPMVVSGSADGLRQVLANLVRNALLHTPDGTPVEIAARREGADAVLVVRDHGPGLPGGDPATLFERFWRAEGGRERGRAGAGLGLAIVAAVVEAHGGSVAARDAEGGGAVFTVRLPLA